MAGYCPRSFFFASLWTSTPSRSMNTQKLCESWSIAQTNMYKREDPLVMHALCCQFIQLFWLQLEGGQFYAYLTAHAGLKRCSQNFAGFFNIPKPPKLERAL